MKDNKIMRSMIPRFLVIIYVLLSFVDNIVYAGITSSFIRSEFPALDMPLDHEVFVIPSGYNAPQQVHITQGDYDGKAVIIMWVTPTEQGSNHVKYGTSKNKNDFTAYGSTVKNYTFYNYTSGFLHTCLVKDLENEVEPYKQYLYRYTTPYAASGSSSLLWYAVRRASTHIIFLSSYSPYGN